MSRKTHHPLYAVWRRMINRCHNPKCDKYKYYGKRGIHVSDQWRIFDNFIADMGTRPFPGASIERIDNKQGYHLGNCRWASQKEQCRNSRKNRIMCHDGKRQCMSVWAEQLGVPITRISARKRLGWSDTDALTIPKWGKVLHFRGEAKTLVQWAQSTGLNSSTIHYRLKHGWSVAATLTVPAH